MDIKKFFLTEKKYTKGLLPHEWVIIGYALLTLAVIMVCATSYANPEAMIWTRVKLVTATLGLWGLYRLVPCRIMMFIRIVTQVILLGEWYPDTYEINSILPNLDHIVASWEQSLFGYQPAQLFSETMSQWWFSETMHIGYASYYFLLVTIPLLYFINHYQEFQRTGFIILTSFFLFYLFFDMVPVAGPQYYFQAIGLDKVAAGVFPEMGTYFSNHQECLEIPGVHGPFRYLVQIAHDAGERPTAAFPSSHVGAATVVFFLAIRYCRIRHSWKTMYWYTPLYVSLCFATVYIKAHYAVDALAGLVFGTVFYFSLSQIYNRLEHR